MAELLVDTTYILPVFGVSIGLKNFDMWFGRLLHTYTVHYNPASIIEAKWIIIKLGRTNPEKRNALFSTYRIGLKVLAQDKRIRETALTNDSVETIADALLTKEEVKDYFDRLIYATAADRGCILLTEDEKLRKVRRHETPKPREVLAWKDILTK